MIGIHAEKNLCSIMLMLRLHTVDPYLIFVVLQNRSFSQVTILRFSNHFCKYQN